MAGKGKYSIKRPIKAIQFGSGSEERRPRKEASFGRCAVGINLSSNIIHANRPPCYSAHPFNRETAKAIALE